MILSQTMLEKIMDALRVNPLLGNEIRRVEGFGELYISNDRIEAREYTFLYTLNIEGILYYFYSKIDELPK